MKLDEKMFLENAFTTKQIEGKAWDESLLIDRLVIATEHVIVPISEDISNRLSQTRRQINVGERDNEWETFLKENFWPDNEVRLLASY